MCVCFSASPEPAIHPPGVASLQFTRVGSATILRRAFATSPLRLLNPRNHGCATWVYLASYGGGLVDGDALQLDIDVGAGARALLSTQASTKIYRSAGGATQRLRAFIEDGALLVVAPDPVVCFAGSSYTQEQEFHLRAGGGLVLVDWITSGRAASGERWAFRRYSSRTIICYSGRRVLYDALLLTPREGPLAQRMGRFNILVMAAIVGPPVLAPAIDLLQAVAAMPVGSQLELIVSAAPLGDAGVLLRIAGVSTEVVTRSLREYLSFLCPLLGDDPWARKW